MIGTAYQVTCADVIGMDKQTKLTAYHNQKLE
jgi:hypothetical protein